MSKATRSHDSTRSGFTLMEIALVLVIVVVVGAVAAPMFHSTLKQERLRKAAESIAADWTKTRATAMQTGETQLWVCQIANSSYSSDTYSESGGLTSADASAMASAATGLTATGSASSSDSFGKTLPEDVSISEVLVTEADTVAAMSQTSTGGELSSATVFFYPDGTSSSARLSVINDERSISVVLNGLAGTVRVMRVEASAQ
jgi:prepilin-type N-terminal cleavage/methylation domain-containing protein